MSIEKNLLIDVSKEKYMYMLSAFNENTILSSVAIL